MVNKKVQRIKFIIAVLVVLIVAVAVIIRIQIYNKNGEKNMPYEISKIIVVSTAQKSDNQEEQPTEGTDSVWNFDVIQKNDYSIYLILGGLILLILGFSIMPKRKKTKKRKNKSRR